MSLPGQIGLIDLAHIQLHIVAEPSEKAASQILLYMAPKLSAAAHLEEFYPNLVKAINEGLETIKFSPISIDNPKPDEAAEVYASKPYSSKSKMVEELKVILKKIGRDRGTPNILDTAEGVALFKTINYLPWKNPEGPQAGSAPAPKLNPIRPTPRPPIEARERKPDKKKTTVTKAVTTSK